MSSEVKIHSAFSQGIAQCKACHRLTRHPERRCTRCGSKVSLRDHKSLDKVWAFWWAGIIAYIPANLYPLMTTRSFSGEKGSTILESVLSLFGHGDYLVGAVVLIFSFCVPISKFAIIAWLALSLKYGWVKNDHQRHKAHKYIEFIGRWSMVDVFVVAALAALIQVGGIMSMVPGMGVNAFALSVILTMLSAESFDTRMFWDQNSNQEMTGSQDD